MTAEGSTEPPRCAWAQGDPLMLAYHDEEWGVPEHDDRDLFELITLEGAQAGLSWLTVLRKREGYRRAFEGFDPQVISEWGEDDVERLRGDAGIIRNRLKIESVITNARAVLAVQGDVGSLDAYLWDFVDGVPIVNEVARLSDLPAETPLSAAMSRDMKRRGFRFVGPTAMYAFMQSAGLVNDHTIDCAFRRV